MGLVLFQGEEMPREMLWLRAKLGGRPKNDVEEIEEKQSKQEKAKKRRKSDGGV